MVNLLFRCVQIPPFLSPFPILLRIPRPIVPLLTLSTHSDERLRIRRKQQSRHLTLISLTWQLGDFFQLTGGSRDSFPKRPPTSIQVAHSRDTALSQEQAHTIETSFTVSSFSAAQPVHFTSSSSTTGQLRRRAASTTRAPDIQP